MKGNIRVGDKVVLVGYEGGSIGHNGIVCRVRMVDERLGFYCESIYGSYRGFNKEEHLKLCVSWNEVPDNIPAEDRSLILQAKKSDDYVIASVLMPKAQTEACRLTLEEFRGGYL